jgi:ABC-type Fe3+/spermidine/putrescine transport system ATPase subunit
VNFLQVNNLKKTFGTFIFNVSFYVNSGETLVVAGPSGSGKTTLLNLLLGLIPMECGEVLINGKDAAYLPAWKRNMAIVFQDLALFPHLNVMGNVEYGLKIRRIEKKERRRIITEMLKIVNLSGFEKRQIETLSGGEKQRVAIARALAINPDVLLFDEPFSGLDAPLRRELAAQFAVIRKKTSAPWIFVTHNMEDAALLGDRIALFNHGKIIETGVVSEMLARPRTQFAAGFFSVVNP